MSICNFQEYPRTTFCNFSDTFVTNFCNFSDIRRTRHPAIHLRRDLPPIWRRILVDEVQIGTRAEDLVEAGLLRRARRGCRGDRSRRTSPHGHGVHQYSMNRAPAPTTCPSSRFPSLDLFGTNQARERKRRESKTRPPSRVKGRHAPRRRGYIARRADRWERCAPGCQTGAAATSAALPPGSFRNLRQWQAGR